MPVWLEVVVRLAAVLAAFLVLPLVIGQVEHKVMAHMQGRLGPMYAGGYRGWAQLIADGVKFVQKEDITPTAVDKPVFRLAPMIALLPYLLALLVIPLGPGDLVAQPLDIGLFMVLAIVGLGILAVLMAGWSSANKYTLIGAMRAAAQLLGYELPFLLAAASVAMAAGTLSLSGIVEAWQPWWLLWQLPALLVFFVAGLAELRRPPFDAPIADSELVFGYMTEYSGLRFALFLLAEYAGIVVISALTTVLFLGGWRGPFASEEIGWLWTLLKVGAVSFVIIWLRVSYPRLRVDQIQRLCWTVLVPVALGQLVLTAVVSIAIRLPGRPPTSQQHDHARTEQDRRRTRGHPAGEGTAGGGQPSTVGGGAPIEGLGVVAAGHRDLEVRPVTGEPDPRRTARIDRHRLGLTNGRGEPHRGAVGVAWIDDGEGEPLTIGHHVQGHRGTVVGFAPPDGVGHRTGHLDGELCRIRRRQELHRLNGTRFDRDQDRVALTGREEQLPLGTVIGVGDGDRQSDTGVEYLDVGLGGG